jgi:hypothetical protein
LGCEQQKAGVGTGAAACRVWGWAVTTAAQKAVSALVMEGRLQATLAQIEPIHSQQFFFMETGGVSPYCDFIREKSNKRFLYKRQKGQQKTM